MAAGPDKSIDVTGAAYFEMLAAEIRALADRIWDESTKQAMLAVAADCDTQAARAAHHSGRTEAPVLHDKAEIG